MENIYVGMRYVPVVVGDWDNTRTYEPLMIVTYQGNSYTSKTYVPTGVSIDNETYWVCTGNYNAQVEAYREETQRVSQALDLKPYMIRYTDDPSTLPYTTLKSLNGNNDLRQGDFYCRLTSGNIYYVHSFTGTGDTRTVNWKRLATGEEINSINGSLTELDSRIDLLEKRRYIFIGDSYMKGNTSSQSSVYTGFAQVLKTLIGASDSDFYIQCEGGSGFGIGGGANHTFSDLLELVSEEVTNKDTITDIFVIGGANDRKADAIDNIVSGMNSFSSYALTNYPNATVHVGMVAVDLDAVERNRLLSYVLPRYQVAGRLKNCCYIENMEYILHNYTAFIAQGDYRHPNQDGQNRIAHMLNSYINGGGISVKYGYTEKKFGNTLSPAGVTLGVVIDNETTLLEVYGINISIESTNVDGNGYVKLCDIDDWVITGNGAGRTSIPVVFNCHVGENYYNVPGSLWIENGELIAHFNCIEDGSTTGWRSLNGLTNILLYRCSATFPTILM